MAMELVDSPLGEGIVQEALKYVLSPLREQIYRRWFLGELLELRCRQTGDFLAIEPLNDLGHTGIIEIVEHGQHLLLFRFDIRWPEWY